MSDELRQTELEMAVVRSAGYAIAASFDSDLRRLRINLHTGVELSVPVDLLEELAGAGEQDLTVLEISPSGLGLHWPSIDADLYVPGLLRGIFGTRRWMRRRRETLMLQAIPGMSETTVAGRSEAIDQCASHDAPISSHVTPVGGNIFEDLGFPPEEADRLKAISDRIIALSLEIEHLKGEFHQPSPDVITRDTDMSQAPQLETVKRDLANGRYVRCIAASGLGDISGSDLTVGKIYEVLANENGMFRIVDDSGESYLYPPECFQNAAQ